METTYYDKKWERYLLDTWEGPSQGFLKDQQSQYFLRHQHELYIKILEKEYIMQNLSKTIGIEKL